MQQTTICVPLDVRPESVRRLEALVDIFKQQEDENTGGSEENFGRLIDGIPSLHFMSMSIFEDSSYDPIFILEVNCDGPVGPFWAHLEALAGTELRDMLRCCKEPLDGRRELYLLITKEDSKASVIPYFEIMTQPPSVFHHGNRGLTRHRILNEAALFRTVRDELATPENNSYFNINPVELHRKLRATLLAKCPWLDQTVEPRITRWERARDIFRLVIYAALLWMALSLPGLIAALLIPTGLYITIVIGLAVIIGYALYRLHEPLRDTEVDTNFKLIGVISQQIPIIILVFSVPLLFAFFSLLEWLLTQNTPSQSSFAFQLTKYISLGNLSLFVTLPGIVLWLRRLELVDSSQFAADIDPKMVREMMRQEDWVAQNHMGSIVHIRPGVLRTLIVRFGHRGLGLLLRVIATDGRLGSMRTVHFAHWAFLNNSNRLLFLSNFDQSWGAYLDDFIEKAHVGLTLAWGCGVGFPPTRFLIYDGASHGRLFKNWALASRTISRFWISAYPELSVDQIERNFRVADALRKKQLSPEEASEWVRDL